MAEELQLAARAISRALARNRVGAPLSREQVRERGNKALFLFETFLKKSTSDEGAEHLLTELGNALGTLRLALTSPRFTWSASETWVNDVHLSRPVSIGPVRHLGPELAKHGVHALTVIAHPSVDDLRHFLNALTAEPTPNAPTTLRERLAVHQVTCLALEHPPSAAPPHPPGSALHDLAHRLGEHVDDAWHCAAAGRPIDVLRLRQLAVELSHAGVDHPDLWLLDGAGLSTQGWHALRVAQFTALMAEALGLPQGIRHDWLVTAFLHDVGYAVPIPQAQTLHGHPMVGVRVMLRQAGYHSAKVRRLLGALHHHDGPGTPSARTPLLARALRIAEDLETMLSTRGHQLPADALSQLAGGVNEHYDPVLLQLLLNRLGPWPPGTVMALDDGRVVRSASCLRKAEQEGPLAVVLSPGSTTSEVGSLVDLSKEGRVLATLKMR